MLTSPFCHDVIKEDFEKSQTENENELLDDENVDPLVLSPLQNQNEEEMIPSQFQIHQLHEDPEQEKERDDDDVTSEYDDEEFINDALRYDWTSDETSLCKDMSKEEIDSAPDWLDIIKKENISIPLQEDEVEYNKCNVEQKAFCNYISNWITRKTENDSVDPIYFILSGRAGCGKSYAVKVVKKFM